MYLLLICSFFNLRWLRPPLLPCLVKHPLLFLLEHAVPSHNLGKQCSYSQSSTPYNVLEKLITFKSFDKSYILVILIIKRCTFSLFIDEQANRPSPIYYLYKFYLFEIQPIYLMAFTNFFFVFQYYCKAVLETFYKSAILCYFSIAQSCCLLQKVFHLTIDVSML